MNAVRRLFCAGPVEEHSEERRGQKWSFSRDTTRRNSVDSTSQRVSEMKSKQAIAEGMHTQINAVLTGIATGTPSITKLQTIAAEEVSALFPENSVPRQKIPKIYEKTKIRKRHMAMDPTAPDYDRNMDIRSRMNKFLELASPLAVEVSREAVRNAGIQDAAAEIGEIILVTSTGFIAPGVDVAVLHGLGLSLSTPRVVVNFMGCAAAMNGLRTAADFVRAHPEKKALMVCIELSSVNAVFRPELNDVIISSLFGDGCAAVVVEGVESHKIAAGTGVKQGDIVIKDHFNQLVEGSADGITLGVNSNGITCELSAVLPKYICSGLNPVVEEALKKNGMSKRDIDHWAIHPGGPKIIEESVKSLHVDPAVADLSWNMLAEYGNLLSVSLMFVLNELRSQAKLNKESSKKGVAFSFAPGVTVEGVIFDII